MLTCPPTFFDIEYVINPFMRNNLGTIDRSLALEQWTAIGETYRRIGFDVQTITPVAGLPDMVFTANQTFPAELLDGTKAVVMSIMRNAPRKAEVAYFQEWYTNAGYRVIRIPESVHGFEGNGDAQWHIEHRMIYGGWGIRTSREAYEVISDALQVPVVLLELIDERFYHLDTCLSQLDASTALYVPEAFAPEGRALLQRAFPRLIEVPLVEAITGLACNGHCPDGKHFIVQQGAVHTRRRVEAAGFTVIEVESGEFIKSGGSVYCMKMMVW